MIDAILYGMQLFVCWLIRKVGPWLSELVVAAIGALPETFADNVDLLAVSRGLDQLELFFPVENLLSMFGAYVTWKFAWLSLRTILRIIWV